MPAPTLITTYQVTSVGGDLASLVTPSFTPSDNEIIIVKLSGESWQTPQIGTPSGGSLTYTLQASISQASQCEIRIFSAIVGTSPGSMTITAPFSSNPGYHAMLVERWGSAQLAASPATVSIIATGAPSVSINTAADGSAVSWIAADWNANSPGTPAYRSGAVQEGIHDTSPNNYVAYFAYQMTTTAGSQTIGMTSPVGQNSSFGAIEIQGLAGPVAPTVTTQAVTNLAATTATGNGTVVSDGGDMITERGICWSTSVNPTTSDGKATSAGTTGSFSVSITGLTNGTLYHARAYAINSIGTSYGDDVTFRPYAVTVAWWGA